MSVVHFAFDPFKRCIVAISIAAPLNEQMQSGVKFEIWNFCRTFICLVSTIKILYHCLAIIYIRYCFSPKKKTVPMIFGRSHHATHQQRYPAPTAKDVVGS